MNRRPMQNTRPPHHRIVSTDELNQIAEKAAEEAMRKLLGSMGLDVSTPEAIIQVQRDHSWVRDSRLGVDSLKSTGMKAALGAVVTGVLFLIWMALKGPPPG